MSSKSSEDEAASKNPATYFFVHNPDPKPFRYDSAHQAKIKRALAPIDNEPWAEALKQIERSATDYRNVLATRARAPRPGKIAQDLESAAASIASLVGEARDGKVIHGWLSKPHINDALSSRVGEWWIPQDVSVLNEHIEWLSQLRDQLRKAARIERQHKPRSGASMFVSDLLETWVALKRPVSGQGAGFPAFVRLCRGPIPGASTSMSKVVREVVNNLKRAPQP